MRRYIIWHVLALFWGVIAIIGLVRHRTSNAALEAAFALLFLVIGLLVKRRDATIAARYTPKRPR
jgi:hypothetical protein